MLEPEAHSRITPGGPVRKPAKTAAILFGLGVGTMVGPSLGQAAAWSGIAIATLGVALSLVGTTESDLVGDGLVDRDEDSAVAGDRTAPRATDRRRNRDRPTLSGLGTRVEQILRLAQEQAEGHRAEARLEAEGIVTSARREAAAILSRANEQAAGITSIRRDLSPIPLTQTPSPDENPSPHD